MIHITIVGRSKNHATASLNCSGAELTNQEFCVSCETKTFTHICGCCSRCCTCIICTKCLMVLKESSCGVCGGCAGCCSCVYCVHCSLISSKPLCTSCNQCTACCPSPSIPHGKLLYIKRNVDLARYVPKSNQLKINPSPRLLSAEIEVCGSNYMPGCVAVNQVLNTWSSSVVSDGSLPSGGFEINTHPAGGDIFVNQISEIYTSLTKAKAWFNSQAGCHIHVDARDIGYIQMANLLKLYYYSENALYQLIPKERRSNHYCVRSGDGYYVMLEAASKALKKTKNDRQRMIIYRQAILSGLYNNKLKLHHPVSKEFIISVKGSKGGGPRYRGLNLHSWIHRGTIEFRFPGHQPSAHDLQMLGILLANLVDLSLRSEDDINTLISKVAAAYMTEDLNQASIAFLKDLSPNRNISDWITERVKFYNSQNTSFTTYLQ